MCGIIGHIKEEKIRDQIGNYENIGMERTVEVQTHRDSADQGRRDPAFSGKPDAQQKCLRALVLAGGIPQIDLLRELKARGYFTILADYTENPVAEPYADKFYRKSTLDMEAIREIALEEKINIIITCCTDQALNTVSKIASDLGLPCYINEMTGMAVTNKQYMKRIFMDHNIPTAKFQIVDTPEQCVVEKFPVVVKPVDCNSSKGVAKVFNDSQLQEAIANAIAYSRTNSSVVEDFIEGKEVSVDIFVQNGKAAILCTSISEKIKDDHKFVIYKGQYPADISDLVYSKIKDAAQRIADAFQLKNCPMLMQVLVNGNDIYVLEFSARTGGCIKYRLIELASGVNIIKATVDLFESKTPVIHPVMSDKYIVDEFIYCKKGVFDHVTGMESCISEGLLHEAYVLKTKGAKFDSINSSGDRIAAIVYVADSYEDYVQKHNEVIKRIKVIDSLGNDMMRHDLLPRL